jgi:hypothetical protein
LWLGNFFGIAGDLNYLLCEAQRVIFYFLSFWLGVGVGDQDPRQFQGKLPDPQF